MATYKTKAIERLFDARWDPVTRQLTNEFVSLDDVVHEIRTHNATSPGKNVSTKNPANFFKDLVRNLKHANEVWPESVFERGYTGAQQTSNSRCFAFVPVKSGVSTPFVPIRPLEGIAKHSVSTLQIPSLARALSRRDETWLIHVAARLQIIELHLSTNSKSNLEYVELLQIGVKQSLAEIDALYMGRTNDDKSVVITVEAKTRDDIYEGQIVSQVLAARSMRSLKDAGVDYIIPLAIKSMPKVGIFVAEFESVSFSSPDPTELEVVAQSMVELHPTLKNI